MAGRGAVIQPPIRSYASALSENQQVSISVKRNRFDCIVDLTEVGWGRQQYVGHWKNRIIRNCNNHERMALAHNRKQENKQTQIIITEIRECVGGSISEPLCKIKGKNKSGLCGTIL